MNRRLLAEHLIRRHGLILTHMMSSETRERFSALKNLERAEKRFLLSFLSSLIAGSYWLSMELWGLNLKDILTLPIQRVVSVILATLIVVSSILAILAYLTVGLVIQRAVEIKRRDSDNSKTK